MLINKMVLEDKWLGFEIMLFSHHQYIEKKKCDNIVNFSSLFGDCTKVLAACAVRRVPCSVSWQPVCSPLLGLTLLCFVRSGSSRSR